MPGYGEGIAAEQEETSILDAWPDQPGVQRLIEPLRELEAPPYMNQLSGSAHEAFSDPADSTHLALMLLQRELLHGKG